MRPVQPWVPEDAKEAIGHDRPRYRGRGAGNPVQSGLIGSKRRVGPYSDVDPIDEAGDGQN
jgi:hypothetical protein